MKKIDVFEHACTLQPGQAMWSFGKMEGKESVCILIREETRIIKALPKTIVQVQYRTIATKINNVIVAGLMVRPIPMIPFETWWNYHEHSGRCRKAVEMMQKQDRIPIIFIGENKQIVRKIESKNSLKDFFQKLQDSSEGKKWSMEEFDHVREKIYEMHPEVEDLWESLLKSRDGEDERETRK